MKWNWGVRGTDKLMPSDFLRQIQTPALPDQAYYAQREESIKRYISAMETEESEYWCKCLWAVHPDDQGIKPRHCRGCDKPKGWRGHTSGNREYDHEFAGIRKRRVDEHPMCPVHTREGMIAYFFDWVSTHG